MDAAADGIPGFVDRRLEKTFCCLNGAAGDFAKIGRLYARDG